MVASLRHAAVGVLAWRVGTAPRACAVTPLVCGDKPVVTSTFALMGKMRQIHADPRVALLAGGTLVQADARIHVDRNGDAFRGDLLDQESAKFPPTRQLAALPGHDRWLRWYFRRIIATLDPVAPAEEVGPDGIVLVALRGGRPWIAALPGHEHLLDAQPGTQVHLPEFVSGRELDGPAVLLAHRENTAMTALAQLRLSGDLKSGRLLVRGRSGSLELRPPRLLAQLGDLRRLGRLAAANKAEIDRLAYAARHPQRPAPKHRESGLTAHKTDPPPAKES